MFSLRSIVTASVSTLALAFAVGCGSGTEGAVDGSEVDTTVDESATYSGTTSSSTTYKSGTTGGYYYGGGFTTTTDPCPQASSCGCLTWVGNCVAECPEGTTIYDGKCVVGADGLASDSNVTECNAGYYLCWSNVQQKSVCTTRKCY